ncbi:hypothetical protein ONE63_006267 [Megalurothrips usitatus]|uniref:MD-2-related lipid-recognition domain-containing protein n=1 Tax=Megalurothrips usitatus TaxID=439358 RepID=A0AAV7Y094_9NEOP|nr:hypothetical protein ONE63_006267 [Megalurothrips usitatus]
MESSPCFAVIVVLVLAVLAPAADACNGFRLVVKKAEAKCADGSPSTLTFRDFGVALTPDCKFVPRGCVKVNNKIEEGMVSYTLKTSTGIPLAEGTKNMCEAMEQASGIKDANMLIDMFQLPKKCPVEAGETCADGKTVDISPYKDKLTPGSIKGEVKIKHQGGLVSCLTFEGALKK